MKAGASIRQPFSDEQLRLAARLYYIDGLGQAEVASFTKVSQAKVSRLLATARERGIVRISVSEYEPRQGELERKLRDHFGLRSAAVIKTMPGATAEDARRTLGHFAAPIVTSLIPDDSVVAIAGGRAMRDLVLHLPEQRRHRVTIVQAMGSIDSIVGPVDALELGREMARRWEGNFLTLHTPAFVPDRRTRDSFLALEQIRSVWLQWRRASVALVGVGTLENSVFVERGVLNNADLKRLRDRGAVGEICGRFFDERGEECDSPWRERVLSMELDQLKRVPQVFAIVAGGDRTEAIAAAIRGGVVKSLIIDEQGAAALATALAPPRRGGSKSKRAGV